MGSKGVRIRGKVAPKIVHRRYHMPTEVRSPINSRHRNTGGGQPLSPGTRSMPGARGRSDQTSQEPPRAHVSLGGGDEPASVTITGPLEEHS
jgi:hypothetical protein